MPYPLIWTEPRDSQLRRMRAEGASWDEISATLRVSRWAAIERGRRVNAQKPPRLPVVRPVDLERDPLPAGHGLSWGILVAGTVLAGSAYRATERDAAASPHHAQ